MLGFTGWSVLIVCSLFLAPALTLAGHDHEMYDFESGDNLAWSGGIMMAGSPFGGSFLGDFSVGESVSLGIMDALPTAGEIGSEWGARWVILSFDLVNYDPSFEEFVVTTQLDNFLKLETEAILVGDVPNLSVETVFRYPGERNDLFIDFSKTSGIGRWGLDNVVVDWNINNVPEPSAGVLMLSCLISLLATRRR
ncbi:MAG: hypothetical protein ACR2RV_22810 [Verrucomicrobiales bacterium]